MICPKCGSEQLSVIGSKPDEEKSVKRRRACIACRYRFNTIEVETEEYEKLNELAVLFKRLLALANMIEV